MLSINYVDLADGRIGNLLTVSGTDFGVSTGTLLVRNEATGEIKTITPTTWSNTSITVTAFDPLFAFPESNTLTLWFAVVLPSGVGVCTGQLQLLSVMPEINPPSEFSEQAPVFLEPGTQGYDSGWVTIPNSGIFGCPVGYYGHYNPTYCYFTDINSSTLYTNVLVSKLRQVGAMTDAYLTARGQALPDREIMQ